MPTLCSIAFPETAHPAPACGENSLAVGLAGTPQTYRHGTESTIVEMVRRSHAGPATLLDGKSNLIDRLTSRGIRAWEYRSFLSLSPAELEQADLTIADVATIAQRLFLIAAGALPLGNTAAGDSIAINLPTATAACNAFAAKLEAAFAATCNDRFLAHLRAVMAVFRRWGDGPCAHHLPPHAPASGTRHYVPPQPQTTTRCTPLPTHLLLHIHRTATHDKFAGVAPEIYCYVPSANTKSVCKTQPYGISPTTGETTVMNILDGLRN